MAITIDEPTLFDNILYYALFVGAIFQICCICAVIFIPQSENEEETVDEPIQDAKAQNTSFQQSSLKKGKREKKKHR
ncbi:hypothetical protein ACF0H5_014307 [Mactra antiquata]